MAFDPDEYLNETGTSSTATAEFDPDAYLSETEEQVAPFDPDAYLAEPSPLAGLEIPPAPEPLKIEQAIKEVGQIEGIKNAALNAFDSSRQAIAVAGGVSPEEAEQISRLEYQKEARKLSPAYSEYLQASGSDAVKAFAKNPFEISTNIIAEGLAGSLYSLGAGLAAGGVAAGATAATGIGAPLAPAAFLGGQIGGTFAGSLATEYGGKVLEELQNAGMDIKDPESIQRFFTNTKLTEEARKKALQRGVPVAVFDGISAGIGGRLARVPIQALTKTPARLAVTEAVAQAALGGGGEIAGAVAAGEKVQPKAVFAEVLGEVGPASVEITAGRVAERMARTPEQKKLDQTVLATQVATRASQDIAPATADAVERQVQDTLAATAETPEQRVARLQREAQEAAGEIELEEEGVGLPPIETYEQVQAKQRDAQEKFRQYAEEQRARGATEEQINEARQKQLQPALDKIESDWRSATETAATEWADTVDPFNLPQLPENLRLAEARIFGEKLLQRLAKDLGVTEDNTATLNATTPDGRSGTVRISMSGDGEVRAVSQFGEGASRSEGFGFLDFVTEGFNAQTGETILSRVEPIKLQQPVTPPVTPTPEAAVAPVEPVVPAEGAVEPTAPAAPTEPVAPTGPTAAEPVPAVAPRPAVDVEALSPNAKRANRILTNTGVDPETATFVAQQYQDEIADLGGEELRAFILDKFEENGGVIPAQMRYSEDQEYYEMAFGISPEEAATLVENAKAQNAQMAQNELEQNKQWRRKDEQVTKAQQGVAVAQPEAQAVPLPAGEVPPRPAIEGRRVPLAAPEAAVEPAIPQLEPLRRVARAEQTEEDVAGLVGQGLVELYKGQPVITQAGLDALPEAERPRLTPEARKIQIDTRTSEAAAEAISKNLRIGVDQVPVDVRMPAGWTLEGDVYVPPQPQAVAPAPTPEVREARPVAAKPRKLKDPSTMTAGEVNKEMDRLRAESSQITQEFIAAGRGNERPSEYLEKTDPLSVRANENADRMQAIRNEIRLRYGTDVSTLPTGRRFGPRARPEPATPPPTTNEGEKKAKEILNEQVKEASKVVSPVVPIKTTTPPVTTTPQAQLLPSDQADRADAVLAVSKRNNYYTLWFVRQFVDGKPVKNSFQYLTILSTDPDEAVRKANAYGSDIIGGKSLSIAFAGKNLQNLQGAKTISILPEFVEWDQLSSPLRGAAAGPIGQQTVGFGKYAGVKVDDLYAKDSNYVDWLMSTNPSSKRVRDIVDYLRTSSPELQLMADARELEGARIRAYEERESRRRGGEQVPVTTLVRREGQIVEEAVEQVAPKPKAPKITDRKAKDQMVDIVAPRTNLPDRVASNLKPQMYPIQVDGANAVIDSMDRFNVALNGDGAGVGKTRQIIAVADHYAKQGKPVVIVTENAAIGKPWEGRKTPILGGSMAKDSEAMGVTLNLLTETDKPADSGAISITTYNRVTTQNIPTGAIVIFDESQNLANTFGAMPDERAGTELGQWQIKFRDIFGRAERTAFYSATPADKPHQLAYLYKVLGFNSPEEYLSNAVENGTVIKTRRFGSIEQKYYDVPSGKNRKTALYKWVNGIMTEAGNTGRFIKREISYEGTDVQFHDVKGTDQEKNPWAKPFLDALAQMASFQAQGYLLLAPNSYVLYGAELTKIGDAVKIAKRELDAGRKIVIYFSRINDLKIRGRKSTMGMDGRMELGEPVDLGTIPSPVVLLRDELKKEGIKFTELHGKSGTTSQKAQKEFAGPTNVLLASVESGGTGINLDDTTGNEPRTEIFMFSPYRGISTIQAMGRIWRASTIQNDNKPNRFVFATASDIDADASRSAVLAKKLQLMNASLGGTAVSRLPMSKTSYDPSQLVGIELPEEGVESAALAERTGVLMPVSIKWSPTRKGGFYAKATADLLEWVERGGADRTGINVSVFKSRDSGEWVALADKEYKPEDFVEKTEPVTPLPPSVSTRESRREPTVRRVQMGRAGMETSAVEARLQELGFPTGGIIRVVNEPDADFEGRTIILDGKVTGIELNASALKDNAAIDRVLNHEFAESANADGALNKLVERLTPKEKKEINDTITRLRYEERSRTAEEAARAIETLAEAWKGRGFFTRAVARVEAWANKLGFKLTRRAAEYIAARNLADINAGFKTAYNRFINVRGEAREGRAFVTPEENARFLELAKDPEANREELQKMVDNAAKKAGFSVFDWWHGTKKDFNTFKATRYDDGLIFFSSKRDFSERWARNRKPNEKILERIESVRKESRDLVENLFKADGRFDLKRERTEDTPEMREAAEKYLEAGREFERSKLDGMTWVEAEREMGVRIIHAYLGANRIFDPSKDWREVLPAILKRFGVKSESEIDKQSMDMLLKGNYIIWEEKALTDAVFEKFDAMMIQEDSDGPMDTIAVRDPSIIKMADPVTYDDQGNVIPLEQRFQPTSEDIRYARRDYQADADSYKINDLSKIRKLLNLSNIEDRIVKFLSRDLLDAKWAKIPVANDATTHGHCWVAAEAAYHILGGKGKDWEHRTLNNKGWPEGLDAGETHHFIQNKKTGEIIDPTRSQFGNVTIPYENSIFGGAFMGKTAESPSIRAKALLHRIAVGETRTEVRESRREPEAIPTFTEGTPEAATLKEMATSMAKVDAASEAKGGKPETYKISEIASVWMDSGLGERELQDAIVEYTNLTPANAAKVARAIAKQYGLQQQIAETGAVIAEIAPEPEGAPRKSAVTKLIEQTTGVRKPVVKLQVSESAALKKQIQLKAREARETRKARKEAAEDLAKAITDYVKANPIRGPINSRQAMSITKKALKLDVNNEAAVDRFEMYVERVIENANYDRDLADARALIKRAKAFAKSKDTQGNVKTTLDAIANISPTLLDNPFEFNLVVQRYLLGLSPVTAKQYAVMPDADVRRYLESLETQIKDNQEVLDRAKAQRILDKQAAYAEERGIPLDEAISILNSEEFLNEKTVEKLEDLTRLLTSMAQESQKDVKAYDDSGATPKQKELISFMRKVNIDSLINEEKKRYIRFANNLLANGATFGMEQFQSIALGQEAAMKAVKDRRLSSKLAAWISPIGGDKAIDTARRIALRTQSEADTFKNIFGREAVGAFRNILGLNRLDSAQTDSNRAKEQIANEFGEYFKGLRKKYGDDATGFEAKGYAGIAGYLIQTDGNKTEAESIPYRRRLMEQNIAELRKSDKQSDLAEADLKEKALAQLTGTTNAEILSQLRALNPASYEQLMWVKDTMLPKWRDFLKEHDENFRNQANNYNNPDHLTITYKFPEGQLLPNEIEDVYQQDMVGMRIKQAANSIKRKDHPNLPVSKAGTVANIDINFGYNQYNALVDQVDKAFVAPAWEQIVAFTKAPEFEQIMGGRANALFVKKLLVDIQTSRTRQSMTDDEAQLVAGGVRLARKISTQAVLGGFTQPLRQVPDQLSKLFFTTGRFGLITKNLLKIAEAAPLMDKFPIGRRGDAQAGTQYASQFSELARKVEASVTDRKWAKYRELMNKVGEFWMTPLRGSDVWAAKVSWMTYYEAYLNKQDIKMQSWEREAELVDTDQTRKEAASYAEWAVDFYGGASDPTKMASLSKQTNNGWKEFAKLLFLPLNSFALQQKNSLISDLRDAYLRTGDRKASIAAIAGTLAGMAAFHGMRIYIIGGLIYPAGKALLMGIFGIDMDEPDEEEKQKQLEDNWRKFKASMYGNIVAGGLGEFVEKNAIDAVNRTAYLWDANINPDSLLNDKGEIMSFRQYEKEVSPLYRFRSYGSSEYSFGLADVLTEQATHALAETQQLMTPEEMEKYTGNEQAYAAFATGVEWMYFFRLMDTDVKRIATDLKRQMDKDVKEREAEIRAIRNR